MFKNALLSQILLYITSTKHFQIKQFLDLDKTQRCNKTTQYKTIGMKTSNSNFLKFIRKPINSNLSLEIRNLEHRR